jgi:hypothetical protein
VRARQKSGKRLPVRQAAFFCLEFSLLLSFFQEKERSKLATSSAKVEAFYLIFFVLVIGLA